MNQSNPNPMKHEIIKILSNYPSHPPIDGSEDGINKVTVDKIYEFILRRDVRLSCVEYSEPIGSTCDDIPLGTHVHVFEIPVEWDVTTDLDGYECYRRATVLLCKCGEEKKR